MPLINPVYGLPNYRVEKLSESEGRNRPRDRKEKSTKNDKSQSIKSEAEDKSTKIEDDLSSDVLEASQTLDTETVVKLLEAQLKNQNQIENATLTASNRYGHVKNLTTSSKFSKEI